ncbi:MAG: ribosome silencing factor [Bacteroidales bacterium]|nr:ribosome silencing factor [Bacteroidales bacterium]
MVKKTDIEDTKKLLKCINDAMLEKKAENIVNMDLQKIENHITKYFVVCTANSSVHANTLADFVKYKTRGELKERPWQEEGYENSEWILLDYVDVVVHVFLQEAREFYKIEQLWADAETQVVENDKIEK